MIYLPQNCGVYFVFSPHGIPECCIELLAVQGLFEKESNKASYKVIVGWYYHK